MLPLGNYSETREGGQTPILQRSYLLPHRRLHCAELGIVDGEIGSDNLFELFLKHYFTTPCDV